MNWHEITLYTTEEAAEVIAHHFHEQGAGGVSIEESGTLNKKRDTSLGQWYEAPLNDIPEGQAVVKGYFSEHTEIDVVLAALKKAFDELPSFGFETGRGDWEVKQVQEEDWATAWKQYYKPVKISSQLVIKPTWESYEATEDELVIEMDPGMAFGTGTHATTALCLRTLEQVIKAGDRVIDVGTGSGILAIAAVKLGASHVLALDLDPVAVSSARDNVRLNELQSQIEVRQSDLLQAWKDAEQNATNDATVQVVVANILAEIILTFIEDVYRVLEPGGIYVASGIIVQKEQQVREAMLNAGFEIIDRNEEQEWVALVCKKQG